MMTDDEKKRILECLTSSEGNTMTDFCAEYDQYGVEKDVMTKQGQSLVPSRAGSVDAQFISNLMKVCLSYSSSFFRKSSVFNLF